MTKITESNKAKFLLTRYRELMEEAYNLRQIDPAISDYDFYEGLKVRQLLELQKSLKYKNKIQELLD